MTEISYVVSLDTGEEGIVNCGTIIFKKVNNNSRLLVTFISALIDEFEYTFSVSFDSDYKTEMMTTISKNILMQLKFLEYRLEDLTNKENQTNI